MVYTKAEDDEIIRTFTNLRAGLVNDRKEIPEEVFVNVFLPFFSDAPEADKRVTMDTWYGISGGAYNEVNVLGRDGRVLYTVPPVMSNRLVAPITREGGRALSSLLATAQRRDAMIPGTGSALLAAGLDRFDFTSPNANEVMSEYKTRWNEIIQRYDQPKDGAAASKKAADDGLDIFEF
jgi:hypothetical protein